MSSNMYEMFATDKDLERNGVRLDYGSFRVTVARAGGANKRYAKVLDKMTKPYRRAMETETMDPDVALDILQEVAALTLVTNWEVKVGEGDDAKWQKGIYNPEGGKPLPVKPENIIAAFKALPDLYQDISIQAGKMALYRKAVLEADAGN